MGVFHVLILNFLPMVFLDSPLKFSSDVGANILMPPAQTARAEKFLSSYLLTLSKKNFKNFSSSVLLRTLLGVLLLQDLLQQVLLGYFCKIRFEISASIFDGICLGVQFYGI